MAITMTELEERQARGELTEAELNAVLDTKRQAEAVRSGVGDLLAGCKRSIKSRPRRKPNQAKPDYEGLSGAWASYYNVACRGVTKSPLFTVYIVGTPFRLA